MIHRFEINITEIKIILSVQQNFKSILGWNEMVIINLCNISFELVYR